MHVLNRPLFYNLGSGPDRIRLRIRTYFPLSLPPATKAFHRLCAETNWPTCSTIVSMSRSGCRVVKPAVVGHFDSNKRTSLIPGAPASAASAPAAKLRHAIYSCDVQLGNQRLATGGGDSNVKV